MPRSVNGLGRGFRDCWTRPERINATRVKMGDGELVCHGESIDFMTRY